MTDNYPRGPGCWAGRQIRALHGKSELQSGIGVDVESVQKEVQSNEENLEGDSPFLAWQAFSARADATHAVCSPPRTGTIYQICSQCL